MNKWTRISMGLFDFFWELTRLSVFLVLASAFFVVSTVMLIDIFSNTKISYFFFTDNLAEILMFYFVFSVGVIAIRYLLIGSGSTVKFLDVFYKAPEGDGFFFIEGMGDRDMLRQKGQQQDFYEKAFSLNHGEIEKSLMRAVGFDFINDPSKPPIIINLAKENGVRVANNKKIIEICQEMLSVKELRGDRSKNGD